MTAAIQLDRYVFTDVHISANPDCGDESTITASTALRIGCSDEDSHSWHVQINITTERVEGEPPPPYDISLEAVGRFTEELDVSLDERRDIVAINGGSLLYSAAREFVLMVTGRGPNPPYRLPTIRFSPSDRDEPNGESEESSSEPAKGE